jgi:hypothetical protein
MLAKRVVLTPPLSLPASLWNETVPPVSTGASTDECTCRATAKHYTYTGIIRVWVRSMQPNTQNFNAQEGDTPND